MSLGQGNLLYNRYRVVEILGRGGMGAVYRATDESLGVDVAVKENLFTTDDYARQFRMEAVILAGIRHPNLPRVTDHFVIDDMGQYLVMDYIEGDDLRQLMEKEGPISEDEAIRIGSAACDALAYLHSRKPPILHRDIKLGNIKISTGGQVYLVDFGLAKMGWEHEETMTGARAMTPGYSPPEQYGSARTDARSDIYSLGATLYAALTGVIPEDSLMRAVDGVTLTPLRDHRPEVSERLAIVIEKALETAAGNRYQSADAFKNALIGSPDAAIPVRPETVINNNTPESEQARKKQKSRPNPKPNPKPKRSLASAFWRLLMFFLLVLVIASGVAYFNPAGQKLFQDVFFPKVGATASPVSAVAPVITSTKTSLPNPTNTVTKTSLPSPSATITETRLPDPSATVVAADLPTAVEQVTQPAESTSVGPISQNTAQGQIAFASIVDNIAQIFMINADGSDLRQLTHEDKGACSFDWSPDGKQIVYTSPCSEKTIQYTNSSLYVLNIESGESSPLPYTPGSDFEPAWSPNGEEIAFTSTRDGNMQIYVFNLNKLDLKRLTQPDNKSQAHYPTWSPDSSQIVYTVMRTGLLRIWSMAADGSDQHQLLRTGGSFSDYLPAWSPDGSTLLFSQTNDKFSAPSALESYNFKTEQIVALPIPLPVVDASFSPDSQWITYETSDAVNQDIYICQLPKGSPQRLTTSNQVDFDPAWRPGK